MIQVQTLFAFSVAVFVLALSPGPDNIYVAVQSSRYGFKSALAVIAGLMTGCVFHTTFLAFGFSAALAIFPSLLLLLKILGACYLFYLAYSVFKSGALLEIKPNNLTKKTYKERYVQGLLMNLLNPKVSLFFLSFFPAFLFVPTAALWLQFYALGLVFILISSLVFIGIALFAHKIFTPQAAHKNFLISIHWVQIFLFIAIGIFLLLP